MTDRAVTLPTAEQVRHYLHRHPLREPPWWVGWLPFLVFVGVLFLVAVSDQGWLVLGGWVAVVLVRSAVNAYRVGSTEARFVRVQELAVLRHWRTSLRLAWRLIPELTKLPTLYAGVVAVIAQCLDQLGAYDAAIEAYSHLIDRLPSQSPQAVQLRLHRVVAQLTNDQLTDADQALRKLRGVVDTREPNVTGAVYRLADLLQKVRTNHWAEAVEEADQLVDHLRPLGIEAGYGHALVALSYHNLAAYRDQPIQGQARLWWSRATVLLPVGVLVGRFGELAALGHLQPACCPATSTGDPQTAAVSR